MRKYRNWAFTINNPTGKDVDQLLKLFERCTNYFAQDEIGKEKDTPHIQGCIALRSQITLSALSKKWLPRAYLKPCYKSFIANIRYCSKNDSRAPNGRRWCFEKAVPKIITPRDHDLEQLVDNTRERFWKAMKENYWNLFLKGDLSWEDLGTLVKCCHD